MVIWIVLVALMGLWDHQPDRDDRDYSCRNIPIYSARMAVPRGYVRPVQSLKDSDAEEAVEAAQKLSRKAEAAKKEYLKLQAAARRAKIEAEEACRVAKHKKD